MKFLMNQLKVVIFFFTYYKYTKTKITLSSLLKYFNSLINS
jgi:hypothetical protein